MKKAYTKNYTNYNSAIRTMGSSSKIVKQIDKLIFAFTIIFLLTLTNSIFLNQIGYFGALLFILIRFLVTKKNPFTKVGLEFPLLLFIIAEIISTVLSVNQPQAFHNLLKRFLLIPIIYTMVVSAEDYKKGILYIKIFMGAALITILAYIIFAYEHFIKQLYRVESKGPSPFQYVMTAGGLISFVSIYYFAFFLETKNKLKLKIFFLAAFILTLLALVASYTRAAWIGTIGGIAIILLIKKKYYLLGFVAIIILLALILIPNESKVRFYNSSGAGFILEKTLDTPGRAYGVELKRDTVFVADYEDGIEIIDKSYKIENLEAPFPVVTVSFWKGKLFAKLVDGRFTLWNKTNGNGYRLENEFVSPGDTKSFALKNNLLYVNDLDSGVTVYFNNQNINQYRRFPEINNSKIIAVSGGFLTIYNLNVKTIDIYKLDSMFLPFGQPRKIKLEKNYVNLWLSDSVLFADNEDGLYVYNLSKPDKAPEILGEIHGVVSIAENNGTPVILSAEGNIFFLTRNDSGKIEISKKFPLNFKPSAFSFNDDKLVVSSYKRNRLLSVIDMYHVTNIQRLIQWQTGMKILSDYPVFGVGDIDLQKIFAKYKPYYLKENYGHLHNNYVHILVILGVFGFIAFMILLEKIFLLNLGIYKKSSPATIQSAFALGTVGAFTGFLISGLAEWNFGDHEIITMVWFTLGFNFALYKTSGHLEKRN